MFENNLIKMNLLIVGIELMTRSAVFVFDKSAFSSHWGPKYPLLQKHKFRVEYFGL